MLVDIFQLKDLHYSYTIHSRGYSYLQGLWKHILLSHERSLHHSYAATIPFINQIQTFQIHSWPWTSVRLLGRWNVSLEWLRDSWDLWLSSSYSSKLCYHWLIPVGFNTGKGFESCGCSCFIEVAWYVNAHVIIPSEVLTTPPLSLSCSAITLICAFLPYATHASLLQPYIFFQCMKSASIPVHQLIWPDFIHSLVRYHADKRATCTVYSQLYRCILLANTSQMERGWLWSREHLGECRKFHLVLAVLLAEVEVLQCKRSWQVWINGRGSW